jgi:hypothetical protein
MIVIFCKGGISDDEDTFSLAAPRAYLVDNEIKLDLLRTNEYTS